MIENIDSNEKDELFILDNESFHDNAIKLCDKLCTPFCKTWDEYICEQLPP